MATPYRWSLVSAPWAVWPGGRPRFRGLTFCVNMFININNMVANVAQATALAGETHLVLYDGVCALCNGLVQFLLARDRRGIFRFASLQSPAGQAIVTRFGGNSEELTSLYVVKNYRTDSAR